MDLQDLAEHITLKIKKPSLFEKLYFLFHTKYPAYIEEPDGIYCITFCIHKKQVYEYSACKFEYDEFLQVQRSAKKEASTFHFIDRKGSA